MSIAECNSQEIAESRTIEDIITAPLSQVRVAGRVILHRSFGKIIFATLTDGSGKIQLLFSRENCLIDRNGVAVTELGT